MITEKDEIEQLKRELKSYNYYVECVREINLKLLEINTKLLGLSSPRPKEIIAGSSSSKYYQDNKMELMMEEEQLINERIFIERRISKINTLLDEMNKENQSIIKSLFMERGSYDELADKMGLSKSSLKRRVNSIIKDSMPANYRCL